MRGRAGNQLFKYFFAKKISFLTNQQLVINFNEAYESKYENDLTQFGFRDFIDDKDEKIFRSIFSFKQKFSIKYMRFITHLFGTKKDARYEWQCKKAVPLIKQGIIYMTLGFYNYNIKDLSKCKNIYIYGNFEDKKYFEGFKFPLIKADLSHCPKQLLNAVENSHSVCVSIRRGDFLLQKFESFNICNENYFKKAFELMKAKDKDAVFVIFGDDLQWCREKFINLPYDMVFENDGNTVPEKLKLMSMCKNFIISNSTFSWWAQELSDNPNKIIISPSKWNKNGGPCGLLLDNFIKLGSES